MKKYAAIALICLYLVSTYGISVSRFYCCGVLKTQDVALALFSKKTVKDDACCKHTQKVIKVSDNQQERAVAYSVQVNHADAACIKPYVDAWQFTNPFATRNTNFANSPPKWQPAVPLYIQLCTYRI